MTLTSTGPSGFHLKPLVGVFAATVLAVAVIAIGYSVGTDTQPPTPLPLDATAQVAAPDVAPSANWAAFEAGKFDDGPLPATSPAASEPAPPGVASEAQSANLDAYATGKLDMELATANPSRYATSAAGQTTANWAAFETGKLDDTSATQAVTVDVSSGNYGPLATGKYDMEYAAENPGVSYVAVPKIADGTSANWAAFEAGRLDDASVGSEAIPRPPVVSGGHQEF